MNVLEKEQEFKEWLEQGHYEKGTIGSRIANCKTVNNKYDLYQYFKREILKKYIGYSPIYR